MSCRLDYTLAITGDCTRSNSGSFNLAINGSAPDYTIQWISPSFGTISLGPGVTTYSLTSLSAGTYTFNLIDSCADPEPSEKTINVFISSGTCVNFTKQNTICGLNNGSITAQTTNFYGSGSFYLYSLTGLVTSAKTGSNSIVFPGLSAGTYYVVADDGGGCTGKTEACVVKSSTTFDFGFYIINQTPCFSNPPGSGFGKIYITGLTGSAPYTYLWNGGQTTSFLTGLTNGTYGVTVTDGTGCIVYKNAQVGLVPAPGVGGVIVTQPTCFASDGQVKVTITGGTAPFYFSGSPTGEVATTLNNTYTFTNVPAGLFQFMVTDAGLCKFTSNVTLQTPRSFNIVSITTTNSNCNDFGGKIDVILNGGTPPYTYELTDSSGNTQTNSTSAPSITFNNLTSGTYTLSISDNGLCVYTNTYVINNTPLFDLEISTTGTTCGQNNGAIRLEVSGTSGPFLYELTGEPQITGSFSSYTFTGLSYGTYLGSVTELLTPNRCTVSQNVTIPQSSTVGIQLVPINTTIGNDGEIYAFVTAGTPTFTYNWSANVDGQTTSHVTGLTAGTYSVTVTDSSGCTATTSTIIGGLNRFSGGRLYSACDTTFVESGVIVKGAQQMLIEGYYDLTSGDTNCILNNAIFTVETVVSGETKTSQFFTATTLSEYPSEFQIVNEVTSLIESYDHVADVKIDLINNTIQVVSDCDPSFPLSDIDVEVDLSIAYDISCESCGLIGNIVLNSFIITCDCDTRICEDTFYYDVDLNYSITGGSGNYMIQISGVSYPGWLNLYPFGGGPINGDNIAASINDITNSTNLNDTFDFRIIDQTNLFESNVITATVIDCISFIGRWRTTNTGPNTSNSSELQLPLRSDGTYNFTVYWGDGNNDTITAWNDAATLHTYASTGTYTTKIVGQIEGFGFSGTTNNDSLKLLSIDKWGQLLLGDGGSYFRNAQNLSLTGTVDYPSLLNTTNFDSIFRDCTSLTTINNSNSWDTSNITNMDSMFRGATVFNTNINSWETSAVTSMIDTFRSATSFNQPLDDWDISNVTDISGMFRDATAFNKNINNWITTGITTIQATFQDASNFNQPLSGWNISNVTDMSRTFFGAEDFNQSINNWDVSNVTTMYRMFRAAISFNKPLIGWFNKTSGVTDMNEMFTGAKVFNQPLGFWNTSNVTGMSQMFFGAENFNQNINLWTTSAVTDMNSMFRNTPFNQPLNTWDVSNVTDMSYMFYNAQLFNQNISSWITSSVTDMNNMFVSAGTFNQPLNTWDVSNVTDMSYMFESAKLFNQPLNGWDVSNVDDFTEMFRNAEDFNQNIGSWQIKNNSSTSLFGMFISAATFNNDSDGTIGNWSVSAITSSNMRYMFSAATQFNQDLSPWCVSGIPTKPTGFDTGANNWDNSNKPNWGASC